MFGEFEQYMRQVIFVSATPGPYEMSHSGQIVEQIIRPTGLVDPEVEVRTTRGQTEDVLEEIRATIARGDRILLTTLTKRLAEELTEYLAGRGIRTRYLHSEIDTLQRTEIIRELRLGRFDVLVGINLLREGLDIPEVGFIGILDADKEGFLRSTTSLIQTAGRAARHLNGEVILYADVMTQSIQKFLAVSNYRRERQLAYNQEHNITPRSVIRAVEESLSSHKAIADRANSFLAESGVDLDISETIKELEEEMLVAANKLEFEKAALLRDQIRELKRTLEGKPAEAGQPAPGRTSYGKKRSRSSKRREIPF
jgi:excinuclease ABC subunit B